MAAEDRLRAMIVDDEPLAIDVLQIVCAGLPDIEIVGTALDGEDALGLIDRLEPDLVLLDVAMPGLDGVAIARVMETKVIPPSIVFCTAYQEFAFAAFEVAAVDYLLKPVEPSRLARALERVRRRTGRAAGRPSLDWLEELWVPHRSEMARIGINEIDWIQAERDYVRLHVGKSSFLLHHTLSGLERRLDPDRFLRVHRSTIVRRDAILGLRHDGLGIWMARLRSGVEIRLARPYVTAAKAMTDMST
jgi:two-component system response regulator AlgR